MATINPVLASKIWSQISGDPLPPHANPTTSLWQVPVNPHVGALQSQTLPETVDCAVIGSGVVGLGFTKTFLDDPQSGTKTLAVFEARELCSGVIGRNGR
jgi:hypothetical protein